MALSSYLNCSKTMKKPWYISPMLALGVIVFLAPATQAQVSASATVTLTVIAAPGLTITPVARQSQSLRLVSGHGTQDEPVLSFSCPQNVLIKMKKGNSTKATIDLRQGQVRDFSTNDFRGVSKVEVVYLGS